MYELVKKKNIGVRILIGILILFAITQTLKFFFRQPTININDKLVKTANEINKHTPIVIGSITIFNNVNALEGNVFQYNYTIKVEKSTLDTIAFAEEVKGILLGQLKTNPKAAYFRENNIEIQANYNDKNGTRICKIVALPKEY